MVNEMTLAIGGCVQSCKEGTDAFWASSIGGILGGILAVIGIIVVIAAVVKGFGKVTSGKMGEAVKIGIGAAIFATFLFNPAMVTSVIGLFSDVVSNILSSANDVIDKSETAKTSTTAP